MTKIVRPFKNVTSFSSNQGEGERTVFGTDDITDNLEQNISPEYKRGFKIYGPDDVPRSVDMNGWGFTMSRLNSYIFQQGIPEWNENQEYFLGSVASIGSDIFISTANTNIGNNPIDSISGGLFNNWVETQDILSTGGSGDEMVVPLNQNNCLIYSGFPNAGFLVPQGRVTQRNSVDSPWVNYPQDNIGGGGTDKSYACRLKDNRALYIARNSVTVFDIDLLTGEFTIVDSLTGINGYRNSISGVGCYATRLPASESINDQVLLFKMIAGETNTIDLFEVVGNTLTFVNTVFTTDGDDEVLFTRINDSLGRIMMYNKTTDEFSVLQFNQDTSQFVVIDSTPRSSLFPGTNVVEVNEVLGIDNYAIVTVGGGPRVIGYVSDQFTVDSAPTIPLGNAGQRSCCLVDRDSLFYRAAFDVTSEIKYFENDAASFDTFWRYIPGETLGFNPSGTSLTADNLQDAVKQLLPTLFPVGKILITDRSANPATYLGFGNWSRIEGSFLVGVDDADPDFSAPGQTGGTKFHSHNVFSVDFSDETVELTIDIDGWDSFQNGTALPEPTTEGRLITGSGRFEKSEALESLGQASRSVDADVDPHTHAEGSVSVNNGRNGGPYLATYIWRRDS